MWHLYLLVELQGSEGYRRKTHQNALCAVRIAQGRKIPGIHARPVRVFHISVTMSEMRLTGWCSQKCSGVHPSSSSSRSLRLSRSVFSASLARHHSPLFLGITPCSGQECQKHPSMKI